MKITIELNEKEFEELKDLIFLTEGGEVKKEENNRKEKKHLQYKVDDIVFESYREANKVLEDLLYVASNYGFVTVADFKDIVGIEPKYIDNNYGWDCVSMSAARIGRCKLGLKIVFPHVQKLS